jgi:dihydroorotate dehydrogenase electron transfer subunit
MLRAIKQYAGEKNLPAQLSLEEKMACGVGACLACVCHSTQVDDHSKVNNKRVCKDGPVFFAEEVEL